MSDFRTGNGDFLTSGPPILRVETKALDFCISEMYIGLAVGQRPVKSISTRVVRLKRMFNPISQGGLPMSGKQWSLVSLMKVLFSWVVVSITLAYQPPAQKETPRAGADAKNLFIEKKCNTCHSVEAAGLTSKMKTKAPDLSNTGKGRDAVFLAKFIKKQEAINGKKHSMAFKGTDEELNRLTQWFVSLTAKTDKKK